MKNRLPSIRQLQYFVTVARLSNFRQAAEKLDISQPTLTSQIAALEASLQARLFERSRAGTLLSPAGRELLPIARQVLEQYQVFLDHAASSGRDLGGTYKIGVASTVGPYLLPGILPELHRRYPRLRLHVREEEPSFLEKGLEEGTYDLIMTMLPMDSSEHKVRPLFSEPMQIAMALDHPLARGDSLETRDLHQQDVLTMSEHHLQRQIANLSERVGACVRKDLEGTSIASMHHMAAMGMGLAFLPGLYIRSEIAPERDSSVKVAGFPLDTAARSHVAAWRRGASARHLFQRLSYDIKSLAMERFGDILTEVGSDQW